MSRAIKHFLNIAGLSASILLLSMVVSSTIHAQGKQITWHSFEDALAQAEKSNRLMLVDVWAPWCGWCQKMKSDTYPTLPSELSQQFVFTRLNRDDNDIEHSYKGRLFTSLRLAQKLKAESVPSVIILSAEGDYLFHISGYIDGEKLQKVLLQTK